MTNSLIEYTCPHCQSLLQIPVQYAGQRGKCMKCAKAITVPPVEVAIPKDQKRKATASRMPIVVGIVALVVIGGVAFWFLNANRNSDNETGSQTANVIDSVVATASDTIDSVVQRDEATETSGQDNVPTNGDSVVVNENEEGQTITAAQEEPQEVRADTLIIVKNGIATRMGQLMIVTDYDDQGNAVRRTEPAGPVIVVVVTEIPPESVESYRSSGLELGKAYFQTESDGYKFIRDIDPTLTDDEYAVLFRLEEGSEEKRTPAEKEEVRTFISAAGIGELATVQKMLDSGTDPNTAYPNGQTALIAAANNGHKEVVALLLGLGADPGQWSDYGGSALMVASGSESNMDIVKALIEAGADVNIKQGIDDPGRASALHKAASHGNLELARLLISRGADLERQAISKGIMQLVETGTPLHWASYRGKLEVVKLLVENGADTNAKDRFGDTPLEVAKKKSQNDVVEYLEQQTK